MLGSEPECDLDGNHFFSETFFNIQCSYAFCQDNNWPIWNSQEVIKNSYDFYNNFYASIQPYGKLLSTNKAYFPCRLLIVCLELIVYFWNNCWPFYYLAPDLSPLLRL